MEFICKVTGANVIVTEPLSLLPVYVHPTNSRASVDVQIYRTVVIHLYEMITSKTAPL
jgi:hypothetical protein